MKGCFLRVFLLLFAVGCQQGPTESSAVAHSLDIPAIAPSTSDPSLAAHAKHIAKALRVAGAPLTDVEWNALNQACADPDSKKGFRAIQALLDARVVSFVHITPNGQIDRVTAPKEQQLQGQGWRTYLVKIHNEAGSKLPIAAQSPHAKPPFGRHGSADPFGNTEPVHKLPEEHLVRQNEAQARFLELRMDKDAALSGQTLEYRLIHLASRDTGPRIAQIGFYLGEEVPPLSNQNAAWISFECAASTKVVFGVFDHDGAPAMASFTIRDAQDRLYPNPRQRRLPDFHFQDQVYRTNGESVMLPAGTYTVAFTRGMEYLTQTRTIHVPKAVRHYERFHLKRWINPQALGWYSGDHHIHASGCVHRGSPTPGVMPEDLLRQLQGEDLHVGCVLSWGPSWYFQKQFFTGTVHPLSTPNTLIRYDVEVSRFPSGRSGHLVLLRLTEDDYAYPEPVEFDWKYGNEHGHFKGTRTTRIGEWPSWGLPILRFGKAQNGVVGVPHSGWGLRVDSTELPNYVIPPMNDIGANEFIVDIAHEAADFLSAGDTPMIHELNIWYHTLNCGFRPRMSGESDFPCITRDRVGVGRSYVKLDDKLAFNAWAEGLKQGRSYVGDGRSHLMDFRVNDRDVGTEQSEVQLDQPGLVQARVKFAAYLDAVQTEQGAKIQISGLESKPFWHLERARIVNSRKVSVEVVVNGEPVRELRQEIVADGTLRELNFDVPIARSSWVALRVLGSSHTNPIFVLVGDQPIRASRRSAQWCIDAVNQCWKSKNASIREWEKDAAKHAYDDARKTYEAILKACETE